jgi:hypothetical protein
MNKTVKQCLACLSGLAFMGALMGALMSPVNAALILSDTFDYADNTALRANWPGVVLASPVDFNNTFFFSDSGSGLISANASQRPATLNNQTLMGINGRSAYREIGQTVDKDFTLTSYVATNAYSRTVQIGLGDSAGAGYSFTWNAALPTGSSGNGVFNIREQTAWTGAPAQGATISPNTNGSSPPTRYALPNPITAGSETPQRINYSPSSAFLGYSEITLTWEASTGLLELFQDGILKGSVTDTTYNSFSRIYVGGGNRTFIDLINLEVIPEPASFSLIALGGMFFMGRRRRV